MSDETWSWVRQLTGARAARRGERIQSLWSGYGEIVRVELDGTADPTVIVKRVDPPRHADDGASSRSHERKLRSYRVEAAWYRDWAERCNERCRVPKCLGVEARDGGWVFALEDLDAAGYAGRRHRLSHAEVRSCLSWLAEFHGRFMGERPRGLFKVGTYWHLVLRPEDGDRVR